MKNSAALVFAAFCVLLCGCTKSINPIGKWSGIWAASPGATNDAALAQIVETANGKGPITYSFKYDGTWEGRFKAGSWTHTGTAVQLEVETFNGKDRKTLETEDAEAGKSNDPDAKQRITNIFTPMSMTLSADGKTMTEVYGGMTLTLHREE